MRQGDCRASGRWFHMQMASCLQVIIMVLFFSLMLLLCRGFNSHMLYPSLSARFPWRSATPLLPRARCPRPSACPTSMLISPYGNESGPAGQLILKRSPGPEARPPRSSQRPCLRRSAAFRCRGPPLPPEPAAPFMLVRCWGGSGAFACAEHTACKRLPWQKGAAF